MESAAAILSVPLFGGLSKERADDLAAASTVLRYKAGERVVSEGETGYRMFVVLRGCVEVSRLNDQGDRVVFHDLGPGAFFGEMSLLAGIPRTADVTTAKPTQLLVIERESVVACVLRSPDLAMRIIAHLATRIHQSDTARISKRSVRQRLIESVLALGKPGTIGVELVISKSDLGERILARRETVSRELARLAGEGVVRLEGKKIVVPDPDLLRSLR